ncbi:hypothetical protein N9059_00760, partial [bacterium]|nr:hypothetical protein [bacterium]
AYGLGRTDKRTPLESPEFDDDGNRTPDRGHNTVGRYAWHFHRGGPANAPAVVQGLAIVDSPGLGLVNHSSHVQVSDSVAYNVVGSAFFTEAGDENGFFDNIAAVRMPGSGEGIEARRHSPGPLQEVDFGHSGHGFWLQGGGVTVSNAKVAGSGSAAIIFFTVPLPQEGFETVRFDASLLSDPAVAGGRDSVSVGSVPLHLDGATIFACRQGVETKFHQLGSNHGVPSVIKNVSTVYAGTPLTIPYTHNLRVEDCEFVGYERRAGGRAMRRNSVTKSITFEDLSVRWWYYGLDMPLRGQNVVDGGVYQNIRDIYISTTRDDDRLIDIVGDIEFLELTDRQRTYHRRGVTTVHPRHYGYLRTNFNPKHNDLTRMFARDIIRLGTIMYENKQLFYYAQAADFVPFPADSANSYVPVELLDKTNGQLWAEYGLSIGDAMAPDDAVVDPLINALVGDPIEYAPKIRPRSARYSKRLSNYRFSYDVWTSNGERLRRRLPASPIAEGWNIFTFEEESSLRSLLVFGDITPPEFLLSENAPTVINPLDVRRGYRVTGKILDNSFGKKNFRKTFKGHHLLALPVFTREDGSSFIELSFSVRDFARNYTAVVVAVTLDENEPLHHVKKRRNNKARQVSSALKSLLGFKATT